MTPALAELRVRVAENLLCQALLDNPDLPLALDVPLVCQRPLAVALNARLTELLETPAPWADRLSSAVDRVFIRAVDESVRLDGTEPGRGDVEYLVARFDAVATELLQCLGAGTVEDEDMDGLADRVVAVADRFAPATQGITGGGDG